MASLVLSGDTSGTVTVSAPAVAGSNTQTLVAETGTLAPIVSGTAVASTSGTSIDFTGIPSWVKRITVMLSGVSTSGTSLLLVRLGTSAGIETSGYASTGATPAGTVVSNTSGALVVIVGAAAANINTSMIFNKVDGNSWVENHVVNAGSSAHYAATSKTLSDTLTQVRITTVNGTDTFDAGTINILYE